MSASAEDTGSVLGQRVRDDVQRMRAHAHRLRRSNVLLITASLAASALGTLLAGTAAATGPLAGSGPVAWRWTCGAIALVTASSAVLTGIHQKLNVAERMAQSLACLGRLDALELALTLKRRDTDELLRDYEEVVKTYPQVFI